MFPLLSYAQIAKESNRNVKEIIVICKTHFDIGYTHRVKDIVRYYRTDMIDKALKVMDASADLPQEQQFAWTLPGWVLYKTMENWPGQSQIRRKNLDNKIKTGQIICHALPFTIISDVCGLEEMVRGFNFSSTFDRKYGLPLSRSAKLTDEPSQTSALATVLANAGVKFLHIGCNWPSGFVKTPGLFWWEGPDGSRILTLYSPIYGTSYGLYPKKWTSPNDPMIGENLIPAKDWPYKIWPAILVTSDNSGPPSANQIKAMFEEVKMKMPGVNVHMGTMDDFYDAIMKENLTLPVVKEAMPDTWIHGIMSDPKGISLFRETRSLVTAAEGLNTQLKIWGIEMPSVSKDIAEVYEKMALYGEHTWGGAMHINSYGKAFNDLSPDTYKDLEASWEDKTDYVRDASKIVKRITNVNMNSLSLNIKTDKPAFVVYNPLPWTRSGYVEHEGEKLYVKNVPPCGYRTFPLRKSKIDEIDSSTKSIENAYFKITFDLQKGCIASLIDKRTNREWVDNNAEQGLGQYLNERFTYEQTLNYTMDYQQGRANDWPHPGMHKPGMISEKEVPYRAASPKNANLKIKDDGYIQTAEIEMMSDKSNHLPASVFRVLLYRDQPYIDMEFTIKDKNKDNWPEADWLCLPFRMDSPTFNVYRQLGVMNPSTDILPGANRHIYAAENGVTLTETDGSGIAVCPIDHPLISLGVPGCWKYSNDYIPVKPVVYLNLYNNQWNTNFRYWYPGTWSSHVRIWTIKKGSSFEERSRLFMIHSMETRNQLQAASLAGSKGNLPSTKSGIKLSRKGVMVSAFGTDPDGNAGTLLRVWEQAGTSGMITITLPEEMNVSFAQPVNLRGEKIGNAIRIQSKKFDFKMDAYKPASFILYL